MKRRLKIGIFIVLLLGLAGSLYHPAVKDFFEQTVRSTKAAARQYLPTSSMDAMYIRQIITADSTTSRTIMWQSSYSQTDALVEYRAQGSKDIKSFLASDDVFTDDKTTTYIHTACLTDLMPQTKYEYRVGSGDKRSAWQSFSTAGEGRFKALIFPDSQSNDYSVWRDTAQSAWQKNPDASFFVNMGDLVDNGEDHTQWNAWFEALSGMIDTIPAAPLQGNHETYDLNWKVRLPVAYQHLFSLPSNGNEKRHNQYYSFDYGDVHFIVLNTQMEEIEPLEPGLLEDQLAWFKQDIMKTTKKWKVVMLHKDVLTYAIKNRTDRKAGFSDIGKEFMPLFDQYGVDLVLSAHLHTYRRRVNLYDFKADSKGPLYILTGVAGNVRYPGLWEDNPLDAVVAPQPETDNYLTLEASADSLKLEAYLPTGEQIDHVEIKK